MLSEITPERFDALLIAVATVTTTLVAFAMIWFALFVFRVADGGKPEHTSSVHQTARLSQHS